jgi:hypothetical protein
MRSGRMLYHLLMLLQRHHPPVWKLLLLRSGLAMRRERLLLLEVYVIAQNSRRCDGPIAVLPLHERKE